MIRLHRSSQGPHETRQCIRASIRCRQGQSETLRGLSNEARRLAGPSCNDDHVVGRVKACEQRTQYRRLADTGIAEHHR